MRRWRVAAIVAGAVVIVATGCVGAHAMETKGRAERWMKDLQFTDGNPSLRLDNCATLAIDAPDSVMPEGRGNRQDFKLKSRVDQLVLTTLFGERFCASYAEFRFGDRDRYLRAMASARKWME